VAKYDAVGTLVWVRRAGDDNTDEGYDIAVDGAGNSHVTGGFRGSADFDDDDMGDVTSAGTGDIFVVKYGVSVVSVEPVGERTASFMLKGAHPNPFLTQTTLRFAAATAVPMRLVLYNALGQEVRVLFEGIALAGQTQTVHVDGSDLSSGVYFARLSGAGVSAVQQLVLLK
jgi:hypothetical protein